MARGTQRTPRTAARSVRRVERKIALSPEADRRLMVHAACTGLRPSQVLEGLIAQHLRRWVASDRGEGPADGRAGEGSEAA